MSSNPYISNGTCYHGPGDEVGEWFPCGNADLGYKTCCQGGDMCLSSHACYNGRFGITYLAGCSDPDYRDSSCPDKGALSDQPWTGLVYCNGTSEEWVACKQSASPTTLTSADACWCPQTSRTVAFTDSSILQNVVQLPTALGGSVIWQPGYVPILTQPNTTPTPTSPASTTAQAQHPTTTTTASSTTPQPTSAETSSTEETAGMTTSTKVGLGVGIAGGCLVLMAALIYIWYSRRKWRQKGAVEWENTTEKGNTHEGGMAKPYEANSARPESDITELDGTSRFHLKPAGFGYKGASGMKSNKEGSHSPTTPVAELPG
ncbi:hypothetical protein BDP55DRAFT_631786 [Colletotrichum godetiae]|uniref:LPXTG-domain-containing protein n=1 Tax=Colletotrichum godetiae TaxID=1209918 RepID=A0AAJ0APE3_9PEZI|nr:uncharacterized protein BDP55DRAFT_631786 [Colletotrichum godetiae]KAK1676097.1 hypothetical protein BDP55DRAFT_631786 [Colletotrichum godetiae]